MRALKSPPHILTRRIGTEKAAWRERQWKGGLQKQPNSPVQLGF